MPQFLGDFVGNKTLLSKTMLAYYFGVCLYSFSLAGLAVASPPASSDKIFLTGLIPGCFFGGFIGWRMVETLISIASKITKELNPQILYDQEIAPGQEFSGYYFIEKNDKESKFRLLLKKSDELVLSFICPYGDYFEIAHLEE